ncbi:MAG TPA: ATP-binding protein, partial [Acidobacteriota bacterium]
PVSLEKVVARVLEQAKSLAENSGIRLKAAGSATVPGDFYQLEKALSNILENAIKFSLRGQEVEMEIQQTDREVLLQCKDEGTGIEAGERVKIFDPFFRGSAGKGKEGTGLGLYIARRIIEMHGGSISAESRRPAGTVIVVRLPRDIR